MRARGESALNGDKAQPGGMIVIPTLFKYRIRFCGWAPVFCLQPGFNSCSVTGCVSVLVAENKRESRRLPVFVLVQLYIRFPFTSASVVAMLRIDFPWNFRSVSGWPCSKHSSSS